MSGSISVKNQTSHLSTRDVGGFSNYMQTLDGGTWATTTSTPELLQRVPEFIVQRLEACIREGGSHIDQELKAVKRDYVMA